MVVDACNNDVNASRTAFDRREKKTTFVTAREIDASTKKETTGKEKRTEKREEK
jgi:hypothetical protein